MTNLAPTESPVLSTTPPDAASAPSVLTDKQRARRQRVIDAALELLESRDYDKIQVKDVAERAEVALGTLYHYFSSKEHLFAEVLVKWAATLRTNITSRPLKGATPAAKLGDALHRSLRAFERQPQLAKLVARLEVSEDPFAAEILARLERTMRGIYVELLDGIETETATAIIMVVDAVLGSMLRTWAAGRIQMSVVRERLDETVALIFSPR